MPRMQLNVHYKGETEPTQQYKCLDIKNRKYLDDSENKKGYYENKESKKQYVKENMWKIERQF